MKALILAAGKGERLRPLTDKIPKVMLPLANKPILEYNLEQLTGVIDEVVIVVGYKAEAIKSYFGSSFKRMKIRYVKQEEQLGTGHAIKQAEKKLKGKFLVMMGDNLYSRIDILNCIKYELSILVKEVDNPRIFGVCKVKNGMLKDIVEKPKRPPSNLINTGLYVLDDSIFTYEAKLTERGEYEVVDALRKMCKKASIHAVTATDYDYITYPWDLLRVNEDILRKKGPMIDETAKISEKTVIEGPVAIGRGAELKNCVVRPYTSIGKGAVIGNFVEIKNSIIMENTKIPHLSYVGDTIMGSNCNLGAGTKVANLRFDDKPVKMMIKGKMIDSGRRKLGCLLGHDVKTGINVSILPGAVIKSDSNINPGEVVK